MEVDGAFAVILVQCFVGATSVLAKQTPQLVMVSGIKKKDTVRLTLETKKLGLP